MGQAGSGLWDVNMRRNYMQRFVIRLGLRSGPCANPLKRFRVALHNSFNGIQETTPQEPDHSSHYDGKVPEPLEGTKCAFEGL